MLDVMLWILCGVKPMVICAHWWDDAGLHQIRISYVALSVHLTFGFILQSDCNRFVKMHLNTQENGLEAFSWVTVSPGQGEPGASLHMAYPIQMWWHEQIFNPTGVLQCSPQLRKICWNARGAMRSTLWGEYSMCCVSWPWGLVTQCFPPQAGSGLWPQVTTSWPSVMPSQPAGLLGRK